MFVRQVVFVFILFSGVALGRVAEAQVPHVPCDTDLSIALDAYLCSEGKLVAAKERLKEELAATVAALPDRETGDGFLVTKRQLKSAQAAWSTHVGKHCALAADLPGRAEDWHYPVANANFCRLAEIETRITYLKKWRQCATEGGGICLP
jgi:uncharacterized protein YecT (DUF1311 family)